MTHPRRTAIIYILFLIFPAIVMALLGFRLLFHERERLKTRAIASFSDRAQAMAENLAFTVADVEASLARSLMSIPQDRMTERLIEWEATNPLIRNVFVWRRGKLIYPVKGIESTPEEQRFITRYDALFTGRMAWNFGDRSSREEHAWSGDKTGLESDAPVTRRIQSVRRDLLELARQSEPQRFSTVGAPSNAPPEFKPRSGWIPWFAENQLFILGWTQNEKEGPVYGIELEFMALLSRLIVQLPELSDTDAAYGLVAGDGTIIYQSGAFPIDLTQKPAVSAPLEGRLPHYRIIFYLKSTGFSGGNGLMALGGILLLLFTSSLILSGALLLGESRRSQIEALRKTTFVANVSHELKTPLTTIRMYAELLRDKRVTSPEKINHYLSVIVAESQRLTRLVNNVLDFGKLEQGGKTYHPSSFDFGAFIRDIIETHGLRVRQAGMKIDLILPERDLSVTSDQDALEQVVLNIMDNAVKYAASGGILSIEITEQGPFLGLPIGDRGPGVPEAHQERIFDKFYRVDDSLTAGKSGSGLGLSIARQILRDLGGDLCYEPDKKGGSIFRARIKRS